MQTWMILQQWQNIIDYIIITLLDFLAAACKACHTKKVFRTARDVVTAGPLSNQSMLSQMLNTDEAL